MGVRGARRQPNALQTPSSIGPLAIPPPGVTSPVCVLFCVCFLLTFSFALPLVVGEKNTNLVDNQCRSRSASLSPQSTACRRRKDHCILVGLLLTLLCTHILHAQGRSEHARTTPSQWPHTIFFDTARILRSSFSLGLSPFPPPSDCSSLHYSN